MHYSHFFLNRTKIFWILILSTFSSLAFSVDTDRDGLPDDWETANGRDPLVADYQRGAMMDKRRLMMQRYANYAYQIGEKFVQLRASI